MGNKLKSQKNNEKKFIKRNSMNIRTTGIMDFVMKTKIQISHDYLVKSPPLGRGPVGEIREAIHKTLKQKRIIKILYKSLFTETDLERIDQEFEILQTLNHPNIMKIYEYS